MLKNKRVYYNNGNLLKQFDFSIFNNNFRSNKIIKINCQLKNSSSQGFNIIDSTAMKLLHLSKQKRYVLFVKKFNSWEYEFKIISRN